MSKIKVDRIENSSGNGFTFPSAPLSDGYLNVSSSGALSTVTEVPSGMTIFTIYDGSVDEPLTSAANYDKTIPQNIRDLMLKHPFRIVASGIANYDIIKFLNADGTNRFLSSQNPDMWTGYADAAGYHNGRQYYQPEIAGYPNAYHNGNSTYAEIANTWISVSDFSIITYNDTTNGVANANRDKTDIATLLGRQWISTIWSPNNRQDQYQPIHQAYMNQRFYHHDWTTIRFQNLVTGPNPRARIKIFIRGTA